MDSNFQRHGQDSLLWGVYRQNLIHGMRQRRDSGILTGLSWHLLDDYTGWRDMRVSSEYSKGLESFSYVENDGRFYSKQMISDRGLKLKIESVKLLDSGGGGEWCVKVKGKTKSKVALTYFVSVPEDHHTATSLAFDPKHPNRLLGKSDDYDSGFSFTLLENATLNREPALRDSGRTVLPSLPADYLKRRLSIKAPGQYSWNHKGITFTYLFDKFSSSHYRTIDASNSSVW